MVSVEYSHMIIVCPVNKYPAFMEPEGSAWRLHNPNIEPTLSVFYPWKHIYNIHFNI